MMTRSNFAAGLSCLLLFCHAAFAQETASTNGIRFTFLEPPIMPERDLPREARGAGITPEPDANKRRVTEIELGIVRDTKDHGALSNVVAGHIVTITVAWADTNRFKTHAETQSILRRLLTAPAGSYLTGSYCQTYTHVFWSQRLGVPSVAARVEHSDGKLGQLLMFAIEDGHYFFAYQDRYGTWWLGQWRETVEKR